MKLVLAAVAIVSALTLLAYLAASTLYSMPQVKQHLERHVIQITMTARREDEPHTFHFTPSPPMGLAESLPQSEYQDSWHD